MKVLIADGNRHLRASGYGALSRAILLALKRYSDIQIVVEPRRGDWDQGIAHESELMEIAGQVDLSDVDVVLRIGTPEGKNQYGIPTIVYTQNALGDLPPKWVQSLSLADALVVPGEFDACVFRKYFKRVFTCPQFVDPNVFKPAPSYRQEGVDCLSFLFVGSYSYRKGVDLLLPAFAEAFADGRPVHLRFHCFSGLEKDSMNHLLQCIRPLPKNIEVSVFNGSLSPSWMNRIYNRHDVVISFSRGEGWCMPLHEGLLCGKPVIAPNSTAMGEALPIAGVRRVKVHEQEISQIQDTFGGSMKSAYGHPGNICWEVDFQDAVAALKEVAENIEDYRISAVLGRKEILEKFTLESIAQNLSLAFLRRVESKHCVNKKSVLDINYENILPLTEQTKIARIEDMDVGEKTLKVKSIQEKFIEIFKDNKWQSTESVSGTGSTLRATSELIPQLLKLIKIININVLIDLPCGDFNWIRPIAMSVETYIGGDVVPEVVEIARQRAAELVTTKFEVINLVADILPSADMIMSRDCLVHLDFDLGLSALKNIYTSDIKWLLITTFPDIKENQNVKTGCWRPLNMELPPFSLPKPELLIIERPSIPAHEQWGRKNLGLWKIKK